MRETLCQKRPRSSHAHAAGAASAYRMHSHSISSGVTSGLCCGALSFLTSLRGACEFVESCKFRQTTSCLLHPSGALRAVTSHALEYAYKLAPEIMKRSLACFPQIRIPGVCWSGRRRPQRHGEPSRADGVSSRRFADPAPTLAPINAGRPLSFAAP